MWHQHHLRGGGGYLHCQAVQEQCDIQFMLRDFLSETCNFVGLGERPTDFTPTGFEQRGTLSASQDLVWPDAIMERIQQLETSRYFCCDMAGIRSSWGISSNDKVDEFQGLFKGIQLLD